MINSREELLRFLQYDPSLGVFTWKLRDERDFLSARAYGIHKSRYAEKVAGGRRVNKSSGKPYSVIRVNGTLYPAHRLAWMYMTGDWPSQAIDHIDGNGMNNCWCNLRAVTPSENSKNLRLMRSNTSGFCGVSWSKAGNKWEAYIDNQGKRIGLGYFHCLIDAVAARMSAQKSMGYHENHGSSRPL